MSRFNELQTFNYSILEKQARAGVLLTIGGTFQKAEEKNANGRVYPRAIFQNMFKDESFVQKIESRGMIGTLGHPAAGTSTDPEKISHVVTKLELRGDDTVYGEADILDTPLGRISETLLKAGVKLGASSRGDGSVQKKGDANEVQNDYKMETIDLVLKPSTGGAYPAIIENIEENEKLIAEALEGLVNSDLPAEKRVPVLLECFKILSVLDANDSADGNCFQRLSKKITEQLGPNAETTILASVTANDLPEKPESDPTQNQQENTVSSTQALGMFAMPAVQPPGQQSIDPNTLLWHQQQVQLAVDQAVGPREQELLNMKNTIIQAQREHTETKKRLAAAESLIEEFQTKVNELEESGPADADLQRRYAAAVELLDEALERLPELGEKNRRVEALEGLLQASIDKFKEDRVSTAVQECLSQVAPALHESVKPVLENCQTPEQVAETFKRLVALSGSQRRESEPLPQFGGSALVESRQVKAPVTPLVESRTFSTRLHTRLMKAV